MLGQVSNDDSDGIFRSIQMPLTLPQPSLFPTGRDELRNWARCGSVNKMHRRYTLQDGEKLVVYIVDNFVVQIIYIYLDIIIILYIVYGCFYYIYI